MKPAKLIVFCALFVCEISLAKNRETQRNDSFIKSFSKLEPKKSQYQSDDSGPESDTDQDRNDPSVVYIKSAKIKNDSIKDEEVQKEPSFFHKIRVPVGGPYCYPEILNSDLDADVISRRKIKLKYSPQQGDESLEVFRTATPKGIRKDDWPYQRNQSRKKKEIRKYITLNVTLDRQQDDYRVTGKDAERVFISRLYGFINPSENQITDDLISFIDDNEKEANRLVLDSEPDPLADFNSWNKVDRISFCDKHINYSTILFDQKIDFDPYGGNDEITRKQAIVRYKNIYLQSYQDTVNIIICPCVQISQDEDDTPLEIGVLPIRYKYPQEFLYAFVYNILEKENEEDEIKANVRALTRIDVNGLAEDRKKRDRKQQKKREQKEKEKAKAKQPEEANENEEGTVHKVLNKLFSRIIGGGED